MIGGAKWVSCFGSCSSRISSLGARESSVGTLSARFSLACSRLGVSLVLLIALVTSTFSGTAYALDPASVVFSTIVSAALSQSMKFDKLVEALAGYWYAAPASKRVKVPLISVDELAELPSARGLGDYDDLSDWYDAYTFPIFGTQGEWLIVNYATGNYVTAFDADLELVFADWYDYFNSVEQPGTGGGTTVDEEYLWVDCETVPTTKTGNGTYIKVGGTTYTWSNASNNDYTKVENVRLRISGNALATARERLGTDDVYVTAVASPLYASSSPRYRLSYNVVFTAEEPQITTTTNTYVDGAYYRIVTPGYVLETSGDLTESSSKIQADGSTLTVLVSDSFTYSDSSNADVTIGHTSSGQSQYSGMVNSSGGGGTVVPPEPIAPPKPVLPEPEEPTEPTIPTLPTITGPTVNITANGNESTTTTTDLQPILNALRIINSNVSSILTNMEDFETWVFDTFNAYWQSVQGYVDYLGKWCSNISKQINDTQTLLLRDLRKANQYLYQLVNKKQSGGGPSIDPVSQPDESWSWWEALIQQLLNALPTAVVQFLQQLSRLNTVFPFSIPWDIGFLLGLFRQSPQTPVFDLAINCSYFNWSAHIDLSSWDALALVVRRGELLAFGMTLITFTPAALKQLEVI